MTSSQTMLSVRNLTKAYHSDAVILDNISLSINEGETVALIGSNGAGKSTLLKCMVGLHENTSGTIEIMGQTFDRFASRQQQSAIRKQIGFVFQNHGLVKRLSTHSNVVHGFLGYPGSWRAFHQSFAPQEWREQAIVALDAVKLSHKSQDRADSLSGGQAQRVAIARALVRKPRLMIADEPAASLDPASGHTVMQQFVNLAKQNNITLIFTSHDMEHAVAYSDRVIALKDGKVHFDRASETIKDDELADVFEHRQAS